MMKKFLLLFLFLGLVTATLQAHPPSSRGTRISRAIAEKLSSVYSVYSENASFWHLRAQQAFDEALQAQQRLPANRRLLFGNPVFAIRDPQLPSQEFFPPLPKEVHSQQDIIDYYLLQLNQEYVKEATFMEQTVFPRLEERLPYLQQQAKQFTQPADPIAFVVQHIPEQVNTIVLPILHKGFLTPVLNYFWQQLRLQRPHQNIVVLAEFLPRNYEWIALHPSLSNYGVYPQRPVPDNLQELFGGAWDEASRLHMRVIGLEAPDTMNHDFALRTLTPEATEERAEYWGTPLGVKGRDIEWKKEREAILKEDKDTLVVYVVGYAHGLHGMRTSLTQGLDPQKTFVFAIYPSSYQRPYYAEDNSIRYVKEFSKDPLETLTNSTTYFPQRLLYFPDKADALAAGFDARLRGNFPDDFYSYRLFSPSDRTKDLPFSFRPKDAQQRKNY